MAPALVNRLLTRSAFALGVVRAIVHGMFLVGIVFGSFTNLAALPITLLRPAGAMQLLPWQLYEAVLTPAGAATLKALMAAALLLGMLGVWTPIATKASAALVLFYEGLLRSFGHFNHDEMAAIYALVVLAFVPCGDGFALRRTRSVEPRAWTYGYPVLLIQAVVAWMYFSGALIKLRVSGLEYLSPQTLPTLAMIHSLDNLHDTQFRLAFILEQYGAFTPPFVGLVLLWELLFPVAIVWPRARRWILGFGVVFHVSTVFLMNLFFPYHLAMYLVFVDWDQVAARWRRASSRQRAIASEKVAVPL
jgi:hypothetical protein